MTIEYGGADLYPQQRRAIYDPARIVCIEASSKAGKTAGCLAWLFEQALENGRVGREFWWIAPVYAQAKIGFRRMKNKLPKQIYKPNESELTLTLVNGARIVFKSGEKSDPLYGEDVWAAVLDEASRMREESWHAVRSTLTATRGPVRMIGNVRGRKNWFYRLSRAAEAGAPGMGYHRLTAYDAARAGVLDVEEIELARADFERLGRLDVFEELYLAKPSEDGGNPFGIAAIEACLAPLSAAPARVAGADLAGRGATNVTGDGGDRGDRDYTAVVMLDANGYATNVERFRLPHSETQQKLLATIGRVPSLLDSTGSGDPVVEWCQRSGRMSVEGYVFTQRTKQDLMENLAIAIGEQRVHFPDGPLRAELDAFQYEYTRTGIRYSAPAGLHDDLVCALALAAWKLPWRRGHASAPTGIAHTSRWTGADDGDAWRKYQESMKPTAIGMSDDQAAQPAIAAPSVITGSGAGKWR